DCPVGHLEAESMAVSSVAVGDWIHLVVARVDENERGFDGQYLELRAVPLHPTSGTTGMPKVAVRPGYAAIEEARHYVQTIGVTAGDSVAAVAPMCHAYAYGMSVMVPLLTGARVVSTRSFQAGRLLQAIAERQITVLPAVPAMLDVLMFGAGDRL